MFAFKEGVDVPQSSPFQYDSVHSFLSQVLQVSHSFIHPSSRLSPTVILLGVVDQFHPATRTNHDMAKTHGISTH